MSLHFRIITLVFLVFFRAISLTYAKGEEPAYCHPAHFDEKEFSLGTYEETQKVGIIRSHAFHLGKVTLVGVGVGNSKSSALIDLAKKESWDKNHSSLQDNKYCTFYLNHPKTDHDTLREDAAHFFIQRDIKKSPVKSTESEAVEEFNRVLENVFDQGKFSFLNCAKQHHYIALGCNEMMHRGPTVFGMLLAFSGCTPEHALEIANQSWGLNGVKRKVRLAVIESAYKLGEKHSESRKILSELFSQKD